MYNIRECLSTLWQQLRAIHLLNHHPPTQKNHPRIYFAPKSSHDSAPALAPPTRNFAAYVRGYSTLPLTDRALIALRCCYLAKAVHLLPGITLAALDCGLQPSDTRLIIKGCYAPGWSTKEQLLIRVSDELYQKNRIGLRTWQQLETFYNSTQLLDLIFCAGAFHLCTL